MTTEEEKEIHTLVAQMANQMFAEMLANAGKGPRRGWLSTRPLTLVLETFYHVAKLQAAVVDRDKKRIREHAADVANMAMMLADRCGVLELPRPPGVDPDPDYPLSTRAAREAADNSSPR